MDITNQNLGLKKLFNKNIINYQENPQPETEQKAVPQQPAFTGLNGLKGLSAYAQASMKIVDNLPKMAPAALLLIPGAAALTGCEKNEYLESWTVTVTEKSETDELLKQNIEMWQTYMEQNKQFQGEILNAIDYLTELVNAGNEQDKAYYETVNGMMKIYNELLTSIDTNTAEGFAIAQQGLALMNDIFASLEENNSLISQYGDGVLAYMESIQAAIENGNTSVISVLELIWADVQSGNTALIDKINDLGSIIDVNNQELLNEITKIYENSELSAEERNEQIVNAINNVKVAVESIQTVIDSQNGEVKAILQEILDQYKAGQIASEEMMKLMYNALIEGNTLDKLQLEQLQQIYVELKEGNVTVSEAMAQIAELLGSINETLQGMSGQLKDVFAEIVDLNNNIKAGNQANVDNFALLLENTNQQNKYLEQLVNSNEAQAQLLAKLDMRAEEAINVLNKIKENTGEISLEELYEVLNANNAEVVATIKEAAENLGIQIDESSKDAVETIVTELEALRVQIETGKTDMESIINILSSIDLNTSLSNSQMDKLLTMVGELNSLINKGNTSQDEINVKLGEIKEFLASIDGTLKDILAKITEGVDSFNSFYNDYKGNADKFYQSLENLSNKVGNMESTLNDIKLNGSQMLSKLDNLQTSANNIANSLEQIIQNQGDDLTYEELQELMKNQSSANLEALQNMLDALKIDAKDYLDGKVSELIAAIRSSAIDLTTTNNHLQTLINLVSTIATTMPDNTELQNLLQSLIDAYNQGNADINDKLQQANDKLEQLYQTVVEMYGEVAALADDFSSFLSLYKTNTANILGGVNDIIADLKNTNASLGDLNSAMSVNNTYLATAQDKYDTIIEKLNNLIANQSNGLTKEELEEVLVNAGTTLEEMLANMGIGIIDANIQNTQDIINAIKGNGTDMTTTNNHLQTIINNTANILQAMQGLGDQDVVIDTGAIESKLESLENIIKGGNVTTGQLNSELQQIHVLMKDLLAALTAQSGSGGAGA